jgi:hypothetical protein
MPTLPHLLYADVIAHLTGNAQQRGTRETLKLGARKLAELLLPELQDAPGDIVVVCTAVDADIFAAPLIEELESRGYPGRLKLQCNWNEPVRFGEHPLSPISRSYREPVREGAPTLVLVQSALVEDLYLDPPPLCGIATARTNITHAWQDPSPHAVFVVAAVEEPGAFTRLLDEFPEESRANFRKVNLVDVRGPLSLAPTPRFVNIPDIVRTRRARLRADSEPTTA